MPELRRLAGLPGPDALPRPRTSCWSRASTTRSSWPRTASSASVILGEFLELRPARTRRGITPRVDRRARRWRWRASEPPLQPDHHLAAARRHGRRRAGAPGARGRPRRRPWCCWRTTAASCSSFIGAPRRCRTSTASSCGRATSRILLAIVKYVEDAMNVAHDTGDDGRAGDPGGRGQRPLLLVVPAGDLHRADQPVAAPGAAKASTSRTS